MTSVVLRIPSKSLAMLAEAETVAFAQGLEVRFKEHLVRAAQQFILRVRADLGLTEVVEQSVQLEQEVKQEKSAEEPTGQDAFLAKLEEAKRARYLA